MKSKKDICKGGTKHPNREGILCWGKHHVSDEGHWAYVIDKKGELQRISWRD